MQDRESLASLKIGLWCNWIFVALTGRSDSVVSTAEPALPGSCGVSLSTQFLTPLLLANPKTLARVTSRCAANEVASDDPVID